MKDFNKSPQKGGNDGQEKSKKKKKKIRKINSSLILAMGVMDKSRQYTYGGNHGTATRTLILTPLGLYVFPLTHLLIHLLTHPFFQDTG
jgi:hypothetical protein